MFSTPLQLAYSKKRMALIALAIKKKRELERRKRSTYVRELFSKRADLGEYTLLEDLENDPFYHKRYFRMSKDTFDQLHRLVSPHINHPLSHAYPIVSKMRLAITLRYLATGCSQVQVGLSFRVSPASVSLILRETMQAIIKVLQPIYLPELSPETWVASEKIFERKWNFPLCVGAIDGKHVRIRCPWRSGSLNFNYKGYFSMSVMAVVSGDYRFVIADIGAPGSESDSAIFSQSAFYKKITEKAAFIPDNGRLGVHLDNIPRVIVGDEAYPLKPWLMRPFPGNDLDLNKRIYNYRLSRARRVVENAFGIWAARWRILYNPIDADSDLVHLIIYSTMILHNFARVCADEEVFEDKEHADETVTPGNWREANNDCNCFVEIPRVGSNNYSNEAFEIREKFMQYFNGDGWLNGQDAHVSRI